jgi:hypothetical protein
MRNCTHMTITKMSTLNTYCGILSTCHNYKKIIIVDWIPQSTEATFNQTNFWCIYSHFCEMKSYFCAKFCHTFLYPRSPKGTKYQISAINSYWEKCVEKNFGRTDRRKTVYPPPPSLIVIIAWFVSMFAITNYFCQIYENVDIMFIEIYRIH